MVIKRTTNINKSPARKHISFKSIQSLVALHILQVLVAKHYKRLIVLSRPLESSPPVNAGLTPYEIRTRSQVNWNINNNDWQKQQQVPASQSSSGGNNYNIGPSLPMHAFQSNQVIGENSLAFLPPAIDNTASNLINQAHLRLQQQVGYNSRQPPPPLQPYLHAGNSTGGSLRKALLSLQNPRLLGGDILVRIRPNGRPRDGRLIKFERSALVSPISLWPNGVIFYELDASVGHLNGLIWKVMQQFHENTCIRFIPRENNEPDYLRIEALRGCFSYIGRIGGEQTLSLGDGCEYKGTISHELLHAVGFFHHQNRSDRDDYLDILWENIAQGKKNQFNKMEPHENILLNEFDYNSVMLYGPHTFGKTIDKVTMKPKREGVILLEVIEKQGLSALDIDSVNKLYKCEPLF